MKAFKNILCAALCASFIFALISCTPAADPKPQNRSYFDYFDTVSTFYDYSGLPRDEFSELCAHFEAELSEYHKLYDIYNEYDGVINIASLNRLAGHGAQRVDEKIIDMLSFAKEMHTLTSGRVNVAMGAVLKIWHEYREEGEAVPPIEELRAAAEHTDIEKLIIDRENLTVELLDPEMSLDVGAIAKGYAAEMLERDISELGYTAFVIDLGGNLKVSGTKPSGAGWQAGVQNPDLYSEERYVYKTELKDQAIVTSGSYQRFYTVGGVRYHHIINSETLMPENHYLSVSIISDNSALSDALSTAIFNMEYDEARSFTEGFSGITVILVMADGSVEELSGLK